MLQTLRVYGLTMMMMSCVHGNKNKRGLPILPTSKLPGPETYEKLINEIVEELNVVRKNPEKYIQSLEVYSDGMKEEIKERTQIGKKAFETTQYWDPTKEMITHHYVREGPAAVEDCIRTLQEYMKAGIHKSAPTLTSSKYLRKAAQFLVDDQYKTRKTGHQDSNKDRPFDRVKRFASINCIAENLSYGKVTAETFVRGLMVDDDQPFMVLGEYGQQLSEEIKSELAKNNLVDISYKVTEAEAHDELKKTKTFLDSLGINHMVRRFRGHRINILNPEYHTVGVAVGEHLTRKFMCCMDFSGKHVGPPESELSESGLSSEADSAILVLDPHMDHPDLVLKGDTSDTKASKATHTALATGGDEERNGAPKPKRKTPKKVCCC